MLIVVCSKRNKYGTCNAERSRTHTPTHYARSSSQHYDRLRHRLSHLSHWHSSYLRALIDRTPYRSAAREGKCKPWIFTSNPPKLKRKDTCVPQQQFSFNNSLDRRAQYCSRMLLMWNSTFHLPTLSSPLTFESTESTLPSSVRRCTVSTLVRNLLPSRFNVDRIIVATPTVCEAINTSLPPCKRNEIAKLLDYGGHKSTFFIPVLGQCVAYCVRLCVCVYARAFHKSSIVIVEAVFAPQNESIGASINRTWMVFHLLLCKCWIRKQQRHQQPQRYSSSAFLFGIATRWWFRKIFIQLSFAARNYRTYVSHRAPNKSIVSFLFLTFISVKSASVRACVSFVKGIPAKYWTVILFEKWMNEAGLCNWISSVIAGSETIGPKTFGSRDRSVRSISEKSINRHKPIERLHENRKSEYCTNNQQIAHSRVRHQN